jgi:hypothetical protein
MLDETISGQFIEYLPVNAKKTPRRAIHGYLQKQYNLQTLIASNVHCTARQKTHAA